jgi:two-component system, OmpR family, response regulator
MARPKIKILLAEDDENLGMLLNEYLRAKDYDTNLFTDGDKAYRNFVKEHYDLCILDVMMPVKDGFTLAKEIRQVNPDIPIIFLTAKSLKEDVIEGFKIGGDDYITKPFSMEELLFRIEAILRRSGAGNNQSNVEFFKIGKYTFDTKKQILQFNDEISRLTTKEAELLKLLCNNQNKILDRNFALKTIWLDDNYFNARSMDVYITKLRKYLKKDPSIEIINVHGKGFKLIM